MAYFGLSFFICFLVVLGLFYLIQREVKGYRIFKQQLKDRKIGKQRVKEIKKRMENPQEIISEADKKFLKKFNLEKKLLLIGLIAAVVIIIVAIIIGFVQAYLI